MKNAFENLGIEPSFEIDKKELDRSFRERSKAVHPDRFANRSPQERRLAMEEAVSLNESYRALRHDLSRAQILMSIRFGDATNEDGASAKANPALLFHMMEQREALSAAQALGADAVQKLLSEVDAQYQEAARIFAAKWKGSERTEAENALTTMRYLERLREEIRSAQ